MLRTLLLVFTLIPAGGCTPEERVTEEIYQDAPGEAGIYPQTPGLVTRQDWSRSQRQYNERLENFERRIASIAESAKPEVQQRIAQIKDETRDLKRKVNEFGQAPREEWGTLQTEIDEAIEEIEHLLNQVEQ